MSFTIRVNVGLVLDMAPINDVNNDEVIITLLHTYLGRVRFFYNC